MCGLSFYCTLQDNPVTNLEASLKQISHRGPDASNKIYKKIENYHIGIGHNRLSILDLSEAANQPMIFGKKILAYNGEVYNHQELRKFLLEKEYTFQGHSDTEIILLLYDALHEAAFSLLNGMFAFVLLDEEQKKFFVVRDKLGIKPIYLWQQNNEIYGSSEIRGLKSFAASDFALDPNAIFEFFNLGFLYEPDTGYKSIKKLMPGHYLELDLLTKNIKTMEYAQFTPKLAKSLAEVIKIAVTKQSIADVPLGTFFSGGVDSSIIANLSPKNELFFAKYENDVNANIDSKFSHDIASFFNKTLEVAEFKLAENDVNKLLEIVDFIAMNTEELISDFTFWPTYQLTLAARKKGYKVMLSGMGGDEIFGGYPRYLILKYHKILRMINPLLKLSLLFKFFPKKYDKKFARLVSYSSEKNWPIAYSRLLGYFSRADLQQLFLDNKNLEQRYEKKLEEILSLYVGNKKDKVKLAQFFDLKGFLSHNLIVSDKASMQASLELRVPLLDDDVVAQGLSYSTKQLICRRKLKKPLYDLLREYLPENLSKRPKTGFNPPLDGLIKQIGEEKLKKLISTSAPYIQQIHVNKLLREHFTKKYNHTYKLWQLLYFSRWLQLNQR